MALVCDTGIILAAMDRSDNAHDRSRQLLASIDEPRVVPAPVMVELDYWFHKYFGQRAIVAFLDDVADGAYVVEELLPQDYERIRHLCDRYADSEIGFVDASVLAVVERLGEPKLATLDHRHFGLLRPRHVDALLLLPDG
jgi:predicted nucleic acid-binding protein